MTKHIPSAETIALLCISALFSVLFAIGSAYDLQISTLLFGMSPTLGRIVDALCELPVFVVISLCCSMIGEYPRKCTDMNARCTSILRIFAALTGVGTLTVGMYTVVADIPLAISLALMWQLTLSLVVSDLSADTLRRCIHANISTVIVCVTLILLSILLKEVTSRTRFRDLAHVAAYTPWYHRGSGGASFPSGHTLSFATLLLICRFPYTGIKKGGLFTLLTALVSLVGYARIAVGAHYLSDVCASILMVLCAYYLCIAWLDDAIRRALDRLCHPPLCKLYRRVRRRRAPA